MGGKRSRPLSVAALLCLALMLGTAAPAAAQSAEDVDGSADIRTAPFVGNGTFSTEIVTGELVWFSVQYTNRTDLSISARLDGVDADASEDLELLRILAGPNLGGMEAQSQDIGPGYEAWWDGGETDTNVWFVGFLLDTTDQLGVAYELEFELSGFASVDRDECGSDCTLDDDLEDLEAQVADLESQVEECGEECGDPPDRAEVEATRDQTQADVDTERAAIIDLCGGEEECDPSTSTPWALVVVLFIAAAAAVGALVRTLMRQRAQAAPAGPGGPGSPAPDQPQTEVPA